MVGVTKCPVKWKVGIPWPTEGQPKSLLDLVIARDIGYQRGKERNEKVAWAVAGRCLTHTCSCQMPCDAPLIQAHICAEVSAPPALAHKTHPMGVARERRGSWDEVQEAQWQQKQERGMQVQQLHLFAVGKVVNFSFTQGAEAGEFVISAELALGCLPQATAAVSAPSRCLQGGELG